MQPPPVSSESSGQKAARLGLALFLGGTAAAHVLNPGFFEPLVPAWLPGPASFWNHVGTVSEAGSAALLARRSTARLGGWAAFVTFSMVYVANINSAVTGGMTHLDGFAATRAASIIRLPLQIPLLYWSWKIAKANTDSGPADGEVHPVGE